MTDVIFPSIKSIPVEQLIPYARNARTHNDEQIAQIAASIREFGWTNPILVDGERGIIAGHGRLAAARKLGMVEVPVIELQHLTEAQKRAYILADNQLAMNAGWDMDLLKIELGDLAEQDFDLSLIGFDAGFLDGVLGDDGQSSGIGEIRKSLADKFLIPPFSVLSARTGEWQDRKKDWISIGIKSEIGRGEELAYAKSCQSPQVYEKKNEYEKEIGREVSWDEFLDKHPDLKTQSGTSIFDPVLCELVYRWFSPVGGVVLDPFAGGSVRGIVAAKLERQYIGHELRAEQVESNKQQADELCLDDNFPPVWINGDSRNIDKTCADVSADLIFSCPPYADLEVYSYDPNDLSTLDYDHFREAYFEIVEKTCSRLRDDRFACFVVGEVRSKAGVYYNFVGDTIKAFQNAGLNYYNEIVLVTQIGSGAVRVGRQFPPSRKVVKTHQNVLVFVKGDGKRAAQACGEIEIDDSVFETVGED